MRKTVEHQGCHLSYTVLGTGPRVVLIQGVGVHGDGWRPQTDELAADYACLSFDHRGIGQSERGKGAVSVDQMANDTLALMDAEGWQEAHIVGHSLGGLIAIQLALTARQRVRSLALLCTFPNGRAAAPLTPRMIWLGLRSTIGTRSMRRRGFLGIVLPPDALRGVDTDSRSAQLAELFGHDLATQPTVVPEQLRAMRATDLSRRLAELKGIPTLVVSAAHDPIAPPALVGPWLRAFRGLATSSSPMTRTGSRSPERPR